LGQVASMYTQAASAYSSNLTSIASSVQSSVVSGLKSFGITTDSIAVNMATTPSSYEGFSDPSKQQFGLAMIINNNSIPLRVHATKGVESVLTLDFSAEVCLIFNFSGGQVSIAASSVKAYNVSTKNANVGGTLLGVVASIIIPDSNSGIPASVQSQISS